jgi:hypothetical protein
MNKLFLFIFFSLIVFSCSKSPTTNKYFDNEQSEELLRNIAIYMFPKAPNSTFESRFNSEFKNYYSQKAAKLTIQNIELLADSSYAFFIIRPVGNLAEYQRGAIGRFKLAKGSFSPLEFEEIVNTPHLKRSEVLERGGFLFNSYLKNKNLNAFLAMKHYIEWPDSNLVYNKKIHEWVKP